MLFCATLAFTILGATTEALIKPHTCGSRSDLWKPEGRMRVSDLSSVSLPLVAFALFLRLLRPCARGVASCVRCVVS